MSTKSKRNRKPTNQQAQKSAIASEPQNTEIPKVVSITDGKEKEEPKPFQQGISEQKVSIVGNKVKVVALDPLGYYVAIDFIEISSIKHVSYNVITDELILVLSETTGRIGETDVPIQNNAGHKTGAYRREVYGQITAYKTKLSEREHIEAFMKKWLGVEKLTEADFEGFKHNDIAKEVFEKAAKLKKEEEEKKTNKSGLVNTAGEPLK